MAHEPHDEPGQLPRDDSGPRKSDRGKASDLAIRRPSLWPRNRINSHAGQKILSDLRSLRLLMKQQE
jgi:hypothetical protein